MPPSALISKGTSVIAIGEKPGCHQFLETQNCGEEPPAAIGREQ